MYKLSEIILYVLTKQDVYIIIYKEKNNGIVLNLLSCTLTFGMLIFGYTGHDIISFVKGAGKYSVTEKHGLSPCEKK